MRARLALKVSGIVYEHREVVLRDKPQEMLYISPKGTVPVLQTANESVIDESLDIMLWALNQNDPQGWLSKNMDLAKNLINTNDGPFKKALDRHKYPNRYPDEDCSTAFKDGALTLEALDEYITDHGGQLMGAEPSLADFAIFPFIRQFANADRARFDRLGLNHLSKWLNDHLSSTLFNDVMKKHTPWSKETEPVLIGFENVKAHS